ncbi:MAG: alpha/beta fold hydrolase [Acidobacteria bacterium]|nr:alpha/beta fold hydrolase [Acidobacteriota bacterium]
MNETVLCGELRVPENPEYPKGRSIPIYVVVIPALSAAPHPDPWVEISGGPGNAATDYARDYAGTGVSGAYRKDRDVLLMDARGMGRSNGLFCEELALNRISSLFPRWPPDSVQKCRERLAGGADLSQYSTARAADDLEAVRIWLGYPQLNLWGYSYGTRSVLTYMDRYPASVRSSVLWGVVPPDYRRPLFYARDSQRALDRLLADCLADKLCAGAFPRVREELAMALERLDRAPVPVTLNRPVTGESLPTTITRAGFAQGLWVALAYPDQAHKLPMVIHHAARGEFVPFLEMDVATAPPRRRYYNAAHLSIICPEETQHILPSEIEPHHRGTFMPSDRTHEYLAACRLWAVPTLPAATLKPVRSAVPTLIVSGYMDPFTPPELGDKAARFLTKSTHLVIRHLSHEPNGMSGVDCLDSLSLRFVAKPEPATLDARCTARMRPPPFVLLPLPAQ